MKKVIIDSFYVHTHHSKRREKDTITSYDEIKALNRGVQIINEIKKEIVLENREKLRNII